MTTPLERIIAEELQIHNRESLPEHKLTTEEEEFFVQTWNNILRMAAAKYVAGKRKYNGTNFFTDCDHLHESNFEAIDLIHYLAAARHRQVTAQH